MADGEDPTSGLTDAQIAADLAYLQQKIADGKRLNVLEQERLDLLDLQQERRFADVGALEDTLAAQQQILANQRAAALGEENKYAKMQLQLQVKETMKEVDKAEIALIQRKLQYGKDLTKEEKARLEGLEDITDELSKQEEAMKSIVAKGSELGKKMAVYGQHAQLNVGKIVELGKAIAAGPLAFTKGLFLGAITGIIDTIIKLALNVDAMESKFRQATGASEAFARNLTAVYDETRKYGVTAEEATMANTALYGSFTNFSLILPSAQRQVAATTQILQEFGVGAGEVARGMQTATKAFGQTAEQAADSALEINALAQDLGIIPKQMAADYATVGTQLAKLGDQGTKAFKDLALVSKITGMEMQKVLTITDKFDTFEGAAEQTGKLNAALGGNFVNAMDLMMETDPAGRFNMIRDSILDAGLSFDSMTYYQRKYFTEAAGLTDVSDLAMMLSGNYDDLSGNVGQTSAQLIDQAKKAKDMKDIMEKLTLALQKMIPILIPLIDWLREMAEKIDKNIESVTKWAKWIGAITIAFAAWKIFGPMIMLIGKMGLKITAWGKAQLAKAGTDKVMNKGITETSIVMKIAWKQMLALGAAALMLGVGIGAAAYGVSFLVKAFKGMAWEEILAASVGILAFGAAVAIMALAIGSMANPASAAGLLVLAGIGVAAMMVGGAVKMAGDSITGMIDSMAALAGTNSPFRGLVAGLKEIRTEVNEIDKGKTKALTKLMKEARKAEVNISATEALQIATLNRETVRHMVTVNPDLDMSFRQDPTGRRELPSETILVQLDGPATTAVLAGEIGKGVVTGVLGS